MPWTIAKNSKGEYCVFRKGAGGEPTGRTLGCHATKGEAVDQIGAIMSEERRRAGKTLEESILALDGGAAKALGGGRIGGWLVRFGSPEQPDESDYRDYFTPETDFDCAFPAPTPILFHHCLSTKLGHRRLGTGTMEVRPEGVWIEGTLEKRPGQDEHNRAIDALYGLTEAGKLSWSSGTAGHRVDRVPVYGGPDDREIIAHEITIWPLGLDASLTPTPAEPRCGAMALKSLEPLEPESLIGFAAGGKAGDCDCGRRSLAENTERWTDSGEDLLDQYRRLKAKASPDDLKAGRALSAARRERLERMLTLLQEILAETAGAPVSPAETPVAATPTAAREVPPSEDRQASPEAKPVAESPSGTEGAPLIAAGPDLVSRYLAEASAASARADHGGYPFGGLP